MDINELILKRPLRYLNQVEKDVGGHEKDVDDGIVLGRVGVPNRYHTCVYPSSQYPCIGQQVMRGGRSTLSEPQHRPQ